MNPSQRIPFLKPFRWPWLWIALFLLAVVAIACASLLLPPMRTRAGFEDKVVHFLVYFTLAAGAVQISSRWIALLLAGCGLVLFGVGIEFAQGALTAQRQNDMGDVLANSLGVVMGLLTRLTPMCDVLLNIEQRWSRRIAAKKGGMSG